MCVCVCAYVYVYVYVYVHVYVHVYVCVTKLETYCKFPSWLAPINQLFLKQKHFKNKDSCVETEVGLFWVKVYKEACVVFNCLQGSKNLV